MGERWGSMQARQHGLCLLLMAARSEALRRAPLVNAPPSACLPCSLARRLSGLEHRLEGLDAGTKEVLQASAGSWLDALQVWKLRGSSSIRGMRLHARSVPRSGCSTQQADDWQGSASRGVLQLPRTHGPAPAHSLQAEGQHERQELQQLEEEQADGQAAEEQQGGGAAPAAGSGAAGGSGA